MFKVSVVSNSIINPIFVPFEQMIFLLSENVRPHSSNSIENAWNNNPIIVSRVLKVGPHPAAHPK